MFFRKCIRDFQFKKKAPSLGFSCVFKENLSFSHFPAEYCRVQFLIKKIGQISYNNKKYENNSSLKSNWQTSYLEGI